MTKEYFNGQYHSPSKKYSFTLNSPLRPNAGFNQLLPNQFDQYPSFHQYIVYNNSVPSPQLSEYKIFGANFGSLDEKNIDLDIVQLNSSNFSKP